MKTLFLIGIILILLGICIYLYIENKHIKHKYQQYQKDVEELLIQIAKTASKIP